MKPSLFLITSWRGMARRISVSNLVTDLREKLNCFSLSRRPTHLYVHIATLPAGMNDSHIEAAIREIDAFMTRFKEIPSQRAKIQMLENGGSLE